MSSHVVPTADAAPKAKGKSAKGGFIAPKLAKQLKRVPKQVKALKRGEGPLLDTVDEVVAAVEQELADELDDRRVLPVVLVVERRPKRRRRLFEL